MLAAQWRTTLYMYATPRGRYSLHRGGGCLLHTREPHCTCMPLPGECTDYIEVKDACCTPENHTVHVCHSLGRHLIHRGVGRLLHNGEPHCTCIPLPREGTHYIEVEDACCTTENHAVHGYHSPREVFTIPMWIHALLQRS